MSEVQSIQCPNCGTWNEIPKWRYCMRCGTELDAKQAPTTQTPPEDLFRRSFGFERRGDGWVYEGSLNQDFAAGLSDPEECLALLKRLQEKLQFDQVCIAGRIIVCNSKPPLGILTSLDATGSADLIASIMRANGKIAHEYHKLFLLPLK